MALITCFLPSIQGVCILLHPQYLGEVSPKKLRGFTTSTASMFWCLGKVLGQVMGLRYSHTFLNALVSCYLFSINDCGHESTRRQSEKRLIHKPLGTT